jgi:WD40 repeat protein
MVSPDGKTALLVYSTRMIMVNLSDLESIWYIDPGRYLWDIAFSKDGSHLTSVALGGTVQVWDAASGSLLNTTIAQKEGVIDLALSGFGEYVSILDYKDEITVWDTATGQKVQDNNGLANPGGINTIRMSPGGGVFLIDGIDSKLNKQVQQWRVTDGGYKIGLLGLVPEMSSWKFSPDANRLFGINYRQLTANRSTILTGWNANNGAFIKTYPNIGLITNYVISPDGSTILAATEDNLLHLVDVETGSKKGSFNGHSALVAGMDFSPDGQGVVSIDVTGKLIEWDVVNQQQTKSIDAAAIDPYSPVVFAGDGFLAAYLSPTRDSIAVMDTASWEVLREFGPEKAKLEHLAISVMGTYVAAMDESGKIIIWDTTSGAKVKMIEPRTRSKIFKMRFSPDEKLLATINTGQVFVWDVATGERKMEVVGTNDFAFSPAEKILVSDSTDNNLHFTDAVTGKKTGMVKSEYINAIAFSPDGSHLSIGGQKVQPKERGLNNLITLVEAESKATLPVEMSRIPGMVTEMVFNPNRDLLAGRDEQGNVMLWNLVNGTLIAMFEEISMPHGDLVFNQEGSLLFVGSGDGTIGIVSTSGAGSTDTPAATGPGETTLPELSDKPYTHTSGSMTVMLPKDWKIEETSLTMVTAADPAQRGQIIILATNTIKPLTDDSFINYINESEAYFAASAPGLTETERLIESQKNTASVTKTVTINGKEFVFITYYNRLGSVVYQVNFFTEQSQLISFIPVYQGVYVSLKINREYVEQQTPYSDINSVVDAGGRFTYSRPTGWSSISSTGGPGSTAPDGSAGFELKNIPLKSGSQNSDDLIYIEMVSLLNKISSDVTPIRKEKSVSGGWQITYEMPSKGLSGILSSILIDNSLQTINVTYNSDMAKQYLPLIQSLAEDLKAK